MTLADVRKHHPMPWSYRAGPRPGQQVLIDANGAEVPLLTMLDVLISVTRAMANHDEAVAKRAA